MMQWVNLFLSTSTCRTYIDDIWEELAEHFVLNVKGEALRGKLSFLLMWESKITLDILLILNKKCVTSMICAELILIDLILKHTHGKIGCFYAAQSGTFFHHEAQEASEDGGHWPRRVPRVRVKISNGETQSEREREKAVMRIHGWYTEALNEWSSSKKGTHDVQFTLKNQLIRFSSSVQHQRLAQSL